jgi:hypothetical protein
LVLTWTSDAAVLWLEKMEREENADAHRNEEMATEY